MSSQDQNGIQIFTKIQNLYPDIQGELENRHCSFYGKLKLKFSKYYQQMQPEFFVSVKGVLQTLKVTSTPFNVSMALQNGIVLVVARTYKNQNIFINSNYEEQEIILNCKGEIQQNESNSPVAEWAKIGFEVGLSNSLKNNLTGAIIYIESNIPKNCFRYKEAHILAFTLACLVINEISNEFLMEQIQQKIEDQVQHKIPAYQLIQNYGMLITDGILSKKITFNDSNWKFIICDILEEPEQVQILNDRKKNIDLELKLLEKLLCNAVNVQHKNLFDFKKDYQIQSMQEIKKFAFDHIPNHNFTLQQCATILNQFLEVDNIGQTFNPRRRIQRIVNEYNSIQQLVEYPNKFTLRKAIQLSYNHLSNQNLLSQKARNLIQFCLSSNALACTMIDNQFLVILIEKNKMLKLFEAIKNCIFNIHNDMENQFTKSIHHLIFSTLPSKSAAILQPDSQSQLWFE